MQFFVFQLYLFAKISALGCAQLRPMLLLQLQPLDEIFGFGGHEAVGFGAECLVYGHGIGADVQLFFIKFQHRRVV